MSRFDRQKRQRKREAAHRRTQPPPLQPPPPASPAANDTMFYTIPELAALFRCSRATVDRCSTAGQIPGRFRFGNRVLYHRDTIDKWILTNVEKRQG